MNDLQQEIREADKQIAANEHDRQTTSAVRVSSWAIVAALIACAMVVMFVLLASRM